MGQQSTPSRPATSSAQSPGSRASSRPTRTSRPSVGFLATSCPALASSRRTRARRPAGRATCPSRRRVTLARSRSAIRAGELSPREAVQRASSGSSGEPALNAFITVRGEEALAEARERSASAGPLHGVPVGGQGRDRRRRRRGRPRPRRILADNVAAADATVVARLRRGRGHRRQAQHARVRLRRLDTSPRSGRRATRGTPSGSAAARAAAAAPRSRRASCAGTLGTDTAGSIRIPAAFCGVTGLRPSTGRVPNRGVVPRLLDVRHGRPDRPHGRGLRAPARRHRRGGLGRPIDASARPSRRRAALGEASRTADRASSSHLFDGVPSPRSRRCVERRCGELGRLGARVERVERRSCASEVVQQLVMLPEAARGAPAVAADAARRLRRRRPRAPARRAAAARDRHDHRAAGAARGSRAGAAALRALRPPRRARDAGRRRRGSARTTVEVAGKAMPYRLALIPFNSPWALPRAARGSACRAASSTAFRSGSR